MKKILLILSVTALACTARGDSIVFSTFSPADTGNTYDPGQGYDVGSPLGHGISALFTAGVTGDLATVDLGLTYENPGSAGPVNAYLFTYVNNQQPRAGTSYFLGSGGAPTGEFGITTTGLVSFAVSGTVPVTMGTQYWLELDVAPGGTWDKWNYASPPVSGNVYVLAGANSVTGAFMPAFRLTAAPVPEPSTLSLISAGLVGLSIIRKRFAKR